MSLSGLVIGILSDDDHFHLVKRTQVESIEDELSWGIAGSGAVLTSHVVGELMKVRLVELPLQLFFP